MSWLALAWGWLPLALLLGAPIVAWWRSRRYAHDDGLFDQRSGVFIFWLSMSIIAAVIVRGIQALIS